MRSSEVTLTGLLICANPAEAEVIEQLLPDHITATRAELGCLEFSVTRRGAALIWDVAERFDGAESFRAHQARVVASVWGRQTRSISREYRVEGLAD